MSKIELKKVRRLMMNEWEYSYGDHIILVWRSYPTKYEAFIKPNTASHQAIFRGSFGDLNHFIREFKKHLQK